MANQARWNEKRASWNDWRIRGFPLTWASVALGIFVFLISFVGVVFLVLNRDAPKSDRWGFWGFQSLMGVATALNGLLITRRHPRHPIGWMLLITGLGAGLTGVSEGFSIYALHVRPHLLPVGILVAGLFNWLWIVSYALMAIFIPLLFPDGHFLSPRWRVVAWLGVVWTLLGAAWMILAPGPLPNNGDIENPFGVEALRGTFVTSFDPRVVIPLIGMFLMLVAASSLIARYRRTQDAVTRHQLKWLAFATVLVSFAGIVGHFSGPLADIALAVLAFSMPVAVAVAILRYRLYDIDFIINRTLVYGALVASIVGLYVVTVSAVSLFVQNRSNWIAAMVAAGVVGIVFHPLRTRLQRGANRLLYGRRAHPLTVLSEMGARMEAAATPEAMLSAMVETVARELKLPYVGVGLEGEDGLSMVTAYGKPDHKAVAFPLVYQGEIVGQLLAAPRGRGETFHETDMVLLENIARQAGAVAHAARLTADLRRSSQRLVTAREEERRRLRRDLHDGLGPYLASFPLALDAVIRLMESNPPAAAAILRELQKQSQNAVREIRRLVYNLRPPALDDLGLTGALRESVARYNRSGVHITFDAPDPMPPLPAAVEVAAFRIVQEGITNVVRHAHARTCRVALRLERDCLCVTIEDDGRGLPPNLRKGVGLRSMQERVTTLGGRFSLGKSSAGGALVEAWLPIGETS